MTEEEAKGKWCPFARPGQVRPEDCGEIRGNRMMNGDADTGALCLGSACMAWRALGPVEVGRRYQAVGAPDPGPDWMQYGEPVKEPWGMTQEWRLYGQDNGGFCGLAGRPQ